MHEKIKNNPPIQYSLNKFFIGYVLMVATRKGFCRVEISDSKTSLINNFREEFSEYNNKLVLPSTNKNFEKLAGYLSGKNKWIKLPIDIQGSDFKKQVWNMMREIPEAKVLTYGQLATAIGKPKAYRAAASACATNPLPLVIPCHRVIPKSGGIGKFGPGADKKMMLLRHEGYL